ncbi:hypothetical protein COU20_02395 [Candidatus Kaiserbacteria bacterium CG10_big_fil_rev_8_21_14_0_10_59_10]|uniref:UDP-glucose/GDP-mannose dehydrogenase family protein n=1 Tax=Candidatus Kaiserbacteria bacterium CG10_big_fil_rev_8_21_14_0_10_59_10 TaxID=1974612 RepID=A0A2H0U7S4_9BACT|nr:MAG: hypothetical protein COU20_02395 [Candidatus Kaiserbacteria bacterium CG10_big_fil_rev_8_21_14_0_10_59_10]
MANKLLVGFIGQGYIGKNYADDFERRGYAVVRYALEEPYNGNKAKVAECDVVIIAVPTPTTSGQFDLSVVESVLQLVGEGKIAVIKSTVLPGTTAELQNRHNTVTILYSPEFLSERTAAEDAAHPFSNIIGMPEESERHRAAAELVHSVLPKAQYSLTCTSTEAELIKYTHNGSGYIQIVFFNMMYDLARSLGCDWNTIEEAIRNDPLVCNRYAKPVHASGHPGAKQGRGAGGHCFIKDMAALSELYARRLSDDARGQSFLRAMECKNVDLLTKSGKDLDLLKGVYGENPEDICAS